MIKLKNLIDEVIEKDIKSVHPTLFQPTVNSADFDKLTLDNLKALRDKAKRAYEYHKKLKDATGIESALNDYKIWDDELKSRLKYINKPITESFRKGKGWQVYEGVDKITTIFENGNKLTLELTFKDKMGKFKDKWRNQAAAKWVTLSRELYDDKELNEIGNEIPKSWESCFKEALNDVRLKPYIKDKTKTPIYDPVNFTNIV